MMLVLIGIVPAQFAISERYTNAEIHANVVKLQSELAEFEKTDQTPPIKHAVEELSQAMEVLVSNSASLANQPNATRDRFQIRREILLLRDAVKRNKAEHPSELKPMNPLLKEIDGLKKYTDGAPFWVIVLIALSLGLGTMIGWKRIVVTIGEKIGKSHLTYAQGASAEIVAASTISASTLLGLPVSTTHVLSSGIAGAMFASGGKDNLDKGTITKILLAWVLTLPVCLTMSGTLFLIFRTLFP